MEIQREIDRASRISRDPALETSGRKTTDRIPLVVTYHPDLPPLSKIGHDHLPILHVSERMKLASLSTPLVANRQPQYLKDLLTTMTLKSSQHHKGSHGCGRPHCKMCVHMKTGTSLLVQLPTKDFGLMWMLRARQVMRFA